MSLSRHKISVVWDFFQICVDNNSLAECNLCHIKVSRGSTGNSRTYTTSGLITHLKNYHNNEYDERQKKRKENSSVFVEEPKKTFRQQNLLQYMEKAQQWPINHSSSIKIHEAIAKMISFDMQPIQIVENEGFQNLIHCLEPKYIIPSRKYFAETLLPDLFQKVKKNILQVIKYHNGISFSIDLWTNEFTTQSFMSLTSHWINTEFQLESACLSCLPFNESHTAVNIKKSFFEILNNWNLSINDVHAVIHDNARNITKAFRDANTAHCSCAAHTLQLVINDVIFTDPDIDQLLRSCRKLVGHFKKSTNATSQLKAIQLSLGLPNLSLLQDVTTRWNSTFFMLERYLSMKQAIILFCSDNEECIPLLACQWNLAEKIVSILRPFEQITRNLSSEKSTISIVIPIIKVLNNVLSKSTGLESCDTMSKKLKDSLWQRFNLIETNEIYFLSTFLDPRFKNNCYSMINIEVIISFLVKYYEQNLNLGEAKNIEPEKEINENCQEQDIWKIIDDISKNSSTPTSDLLFKNEINNYINDVVLSRNECPFIWWKENQLIYPNLYVIARKYLSLPATTVPSERIFSNAGDICSSHRSRLLPQNAELLIFLKANKKFSN